MPGNPPNHPFLYKDNANREQIAQTCLKIYAEMQLIFYKGTKYIRRDRKNMHQENPFVYFDNQKVSLPL